MVRQQDGDLIVSHSSIALLQERFKQLERMKEMREQKEVLRLFPVSERTTSPTMHYEPSRRYCNPELSLSPRPSPQGSLSSRPESHHNKQTDYRDVDTPLLMNLWPKNRALHRTSFTCDNNEVDTSLHL
ncbi:hypothetical protein IFM89_021839 [Coptis chinensis]|uniref:Uncharacterized protein n=1 Tax=Coptis chinensis TaxID=261450 RepID=A0A835I5C4_9MAGN|nr:hypothetical protein IFM89_021839 [Coptis chinensis]